MKFLKDYIIVNKFENISNDLCQSLFTKHSSSIEQREFSFDRQMFVITVENFLNEEKTYGIQFY